MPTTTFTTSFREDGVLIVAGELDVGTADELDAALGGIDAPSEVDLLSVTFIDSSGVNALLRGCRRNGAGLRVVAASALVRRVFELTGVSSLLLAPPTDTTTKQGDSPTATDQPDLANL